jgi:prevent-host-death family protein
MTDVAHRVTPEKDLRNRVGEVLRRAEAGEQFTITVSGRPVAQFGPVRSARRAAHHRADVLRGAVPWVSEVGGSLAGGPCATKVGSVPSGD